MIQVSEFNIVDIGLSAIIALSFLFGLWRGLIREVFALVTWVAALLVARVYSSALAPVFYGVFESDTTRYVAAFTLLFIVTLIVGTLITHLLSKLMTIVGLKLTDRLLGGVFGIARGVLFNMLLIFVLSGILSSSLEWQESRLIPHGIRLIDKSRIFINDLSDWEGFGAAVENL